MLRAWAQMKCELSVMTNSGYQWYHTCAPGPNHHESSLRNVLWQPRVTVGDANKFLFLIVIIAPGAAGSMDLVAIVPTKVSPECRLVITPHERPTTLAIWLATSPVRETERDRSFQNGLILSRRRGLTCDT